MFSCICTVDDFSMSLPRDSTPINTDSLCVADSWLAEVSLPDHKKEPLFCTPAKIWCESKVQCWNGTDKMVALQQQHNLGHYSCTCCSTQSWSVPLQVRTKIITLEWKSLRWRWGTLGWFRSHELLLTWNLLSRLFNVKCRIFWPSVWTAKIAICRE